MSDSITQPSVFGALWYQFLYSTGDLFGIGMMTPEQITIYGDLALSFETGSYNFVDTAQNKAIQPVNGLDLKEAGWYSKLINDSLQKSKIPNQFYLLTTNKETYDKSIAENSVFGLSFLPWNTGILPNADKTAYHGMHVYGDDDALKLFNPLRSEVLMMKMQTIAILGIAVTVVVYGSKIMIRKLFKRRR